MSLLTVAPGGGGGGLTAIPVIYAPVSTFFLICTRSILAALLSASCRNCTHTLGTKYTKGVGVLLVAQKDNETGNRQYGMHTVAHSKGDATTLALCIENGGTHP